VGRLDRASGRSSTKATQYMLICRSFYRQAAQEPLQGVPWYRQGQGCRFQEGEEGQIDVGFNGVYQRFISCHVGSLGL